MMNKKELEEQLKVMNVAILKIEPLLKITDKEEVLNTLETEMNAPTFWDNPENAQKVSQKASEVKRIISDFTKLKNGVIALSELLGMADESEIEEMEKEAEDLLVILKGLESEQLFAGDFDGNNAILSINVGNGGQDAEDFSAMLLRMYARFAEKENWKVSTIEKSESDAGLRSAMLEISGEKAYGKLRSEHGVHRLIRLSPFNSKGLRQTSFARIEVIPEIEENQIEIEAGDLRIDVFRSSGPGGQSVNTTDSAVRITYLPLNLTVTCQNEKSQQQNKQSAMKVLRGKLAQLQAQEQAEKIKDLKGSMMENSFGSQIRTYTLQPYQLVKDHRTNHESGNPDKVLSGDLNDFIFAYLEHTGQQNN